jgi:hypothetical protein
MIQNFSQRNGPPFSIYAIIHPIFWMFIKLVFGTNRRAGRLFYAIVVNATVRTFAIEFVIREFALSISPPLNSRAPFFLIVYKLAQLKWLFTIITVVHRFGARLEIVIFVNVYLGIVINTLSGGIKGGGGGD